jgi:diguanylate cyclase
MSQMYHQTRDETAAILKRVIAEMGQHDAPYHPVTFTVWYEHFAGINPSLSRAIELSRQQHARLSGDTIEALYRAHVAEPDAEATRNVSGQFEKVMAVVAEKAQATGRDAQIYGGQLEGLSRVLRADQDAATTTTLTPHLNEVADGTQRMQSAVAALAQAVAEGHSEIQRLRDALDRSRTEAITDPLSLLLNRKGFDEALRKTLAQPAPSGKSHCLVMLDIDHFKRVNDTYGHPVGDTVIQTLGQLLQRVAQGPGVAPARVGAEEFAVFMADSTLGQADQLAQAVQGLVPGTRFRKRGSQETIATVTISAGVAAYTKGDDGAALVAAADAALYRSKQNGRDRVTVA